MARIRNTVSDPIDFCRMCFPSEAEAEERFGEGPDGPDGRGNCFCYDDEHPEYSGTGYTCHDCGIELTDND